MSTDKPNDIPQDVWDRADLAVWGHATAEEAVARSILEERERCAKICQDNIEVVSGRNGRWLEPHVILNEEVHTGLTYAKAIRGEL